MSEQETEAEIETEDEAPEIEEPKAPERNWEAEAREMGWKPRDQWRGPENGWKSAEDFVRKGEEFLPFVKASLERERSRNSEMEARNEERVRRLEESYIKAMERQKAQYKAEMDAIQAQMDMAVEAGDVAAYKALNRKRDAMGTAPEVPEKPKTEGTDHPAVVEWGRHNPWFYNNPVMRSLAISTAGTVAQGGGDVHAQIRAAEDEVKRRFPEHFPANGAQPRPPVVESGGQSVRGTSRKREKGVSDLPPEARRAFDKFVQDKIYKAEDLARYAKAYWEQ